jgi:hypothetical protein
MIIRVLMLLLTTLSLQCKAEAVPYLRCFEIASSRHDVPLSMLLGVARVESDFNADARSAAGAHGIMQIRWPLTARHLGVSRLSTLYNPCVNIDLGASYLRELMNRYKNDVTMTLAAYNYGPTRLKSHRDIPHSVIIYVNRVLSNTTLNYHQPDVPLESETIELVSFGKRWQAQKYIAALDHLIPGLSAYLVEGRRTHHVFVNTEKLNPLDRLRLNRLMSPRGGKT